VSRASLYLSVNPFETRVALRENERLVTYRIERHRATSVVGNLYKGLVTRVLPGMQAAFLDIGLPKDGFLYVREAGGLLEDFSDLFPGQEGEPLEVPASAAIGDLLQEGQEVLVQVVKEGIGNKGARLTTYVTLPGRFLVYLPTVSQRGVSRRITDEEERQRLRSIVEEFPGPGGWIVRTAGEGLEREDLERDREMLIALWEQIHAAAERTRAPSLVHHELSPVLRTVRDLFTDEVAECWIDDVDSYREVLEFLERFDPDLVSRLRLFRRSADLMAAFGVEEELEKALRPKIWLKSGGYLIVSPTEALVAIDVNTGKFVGSTSLEDTAFRINMEAVREIVRQLRLRDLGGIIVIDFIDMEDPGHRRQVYQALAEELRHDPARSQLLPMSDIGLVQLTRKRSRPSLERALSRECPYCHGRGRIKSLATICLEIRRAILELAEHERTETVSVVVHPQISHYLQGSYRDVLRELEEEHGIQVVLKENPLFHQEQFEILA
jgi:ribonuclease G